MKIRVKVPATSANLGPGFDIAGVALKLYNEVAIEKAGKGVNGRIVIEGEGKNTLPRNEDNIVWQAMKETFLSRKFSKKYKLTDFNIKLDNHIPLASGMGSSAAARLCGILSANEFMKKALSKDDVISLGLKLEGHPDNIVPALSGGLCVCAVGKLKVKYIKLPAPDLTAVVCNPDFGLVTERTRKVLPRSIALQDSVFNSSRLAFFLCSLMRRDYKLLGFAMDDKLHQPYREHLIPGMEKIFEAALGAGAYGVALSGAGPSIIALTKAVKAPAVSQAMLEKWLDFNITGRTFTLDCDNDGAQITRK